MTPGLDGASLFATTGRGFYRSDDGGHRWRHLMRGLDRHYTVPLVASRLRPGRLYTAAAASPPPGWSRGADAALYRSDDGGEHWMVLEKSLPLAFDAMVRQIAVDDTDTVSIASGHELFVSHDGGDSLATADRRSAHRERAQRHVEGGIMACSGTFRLNRVVLVASLLLVGSSTAAFGHRPWRLTTPRPTARPSASRGRPTGWPGEAPEDGP